MYVVCTIIQFMTCTICTMLEWGYVILYLLRVMVTRSWYWTRSHLLPVHSPHSEHTLVVHNNLYLTRSRSLVIMCTKQIFVFFVFTRSYLELLITIEFPLFHSDHGVSKTLKFVYLNKKPG